MSDLDLPYEDSPPGHSLSTDDTDLSGGVVVMAGMLPIDGKGQPCLIFRFATPDGRFYKPIALVAPADQLLKLADVVRPAARAAVRAAKEARP